MPQQALTSPVHRLEVSYIQPALQRREQEGSLRFLTPYASGVDFSSNDYLGLAHSKEQMEEVQEMYHKVTSSLDKTPLGGSTGSRLLTGDSHYAHHLEAKLAQYHSAKAAILCNSGYVANLSVLSCLSKDSNNVLLLLDELCHNSLQMGVRLGNTSRGQTMQHTFRHNCLQDLEDKLKRLAATNVVIVVESIYSMDGDAAPLTRIFDLALRYNACVVVDEAHGLGVCGSTGLGLLHSCKLQHHPSLLCSIFTFGKAAGCHGAVVCSSSKQWIQFLYNYGRPIVYSTSLPLHALVSIDCAYMTMTSKQGNQLRQQLQANVDLFRDLIQQHVMTRHANLSNIALVESYSPIQALIIPNNHDCVDFCNRLHQKSQRSIKLFPIRSPTVPKGMERVRVVVHAHNSRNEILHLVRLMQHTLEEMKLIHGTSVQPQNATVHSRL